MSNSSSIKVLPPLGNDYLHAPQIQFSKIAKLGLANFNIYNGISASFKVIFTSVFTVYFSLIRQLYKKPFWLSLQNLHKKKSLLFIPDLKDTGRPSTSEEFLPPLHDHFGLQDGEG